MEEEGGGEGSLNVFGEEDETWLSELPEDCEMMGMGMGMGAGVGERETTQEITQGLSTASIPAGVTRLDSGTAKAIRKGQIVTKISDVVRELVENSVDSGSTRVQVLLDNFGLDKIEVRDNGNGITVEDIKVAVAGGYTSKVENQEHPSLQEYYGFRGEALCSICSMSKVNITTRTDGESTARKYVLDKNADIVTESTAAYGQGTIVIVEKLFENVPVRRQWVHDKMKKTKELQEIEYFLKGLAISNPRIYISLTHNGNMVWNKASVSSMDQALMAVMGHQIAKGLEKCGPFEVNEGSTRIEAFFLKKPVNMKTMSYTSNKMTFFFVNRKRVYIRELEKVLQLYNYAALEKPAPADRRRFPVAVVSIEVPPDEADFNLDMDKSKVLLVHKDAIAKKFEEMLQAFYGVENLENIDELDRSSGSKQVIPTKLQDTNSRKPISKRGDPPGEEAAKNDIIKSFLADIPSVSSGFSQSPVPGHGSCSQTASDLRMLRLVPSPTKRVESLSHFDELLMDTPPEERVRPNFPEKIINPDDDRGTHHSRHTREYQDADLSANSSEVPKGFDLFQWTRGQIPNPNSTGQALQNVRVIISDPPPQAQDRSAFDIIGSGFGVNTGPPEPKRPKVHYEKQRGNGISLSSTPKVVTLDQYATSCASTSRTRRPSSSSCTSQSSGISEPKRPPKSGSWSKSGNQARLPSGSCGSLWSYKPTIPKPVLQANPNSFNVTNLGSASGTGYTQKPQVSASIIGSMTDPNFCIAKINTWLGVFNPMNMLKQFPTLKYDLKITVHKSPEGSYQVNQDCIPRLLHEFAQRCNNLECDEYLQIFRRIVTLPDISEQMKVHL